MKIPALVFCALTVPLYAGTSGKEVIPEPIPQPSLATWFAGGSVGYLTELEEPMYHLHLGQDTGHQFAGWDFAWFLEIGYTEKEETYTGLSSTPVIGPQSFSLDQLEAFLQANAGPIGTWGYDLDVIPITLNAKLERELSGKLSTYVGAGLGMSRVDLDVSAGAMGLSGDDWVFTAQAFAGLIYNVNADWELYSGARWIYFEDADIDGATLQLDDDVLIELGVRYNF